MKEGEEKKVKRGGGRREDRERDETRESEERKGRYTFMLWK